jgi:predicted Rossmann fold flavoprotein
MDWFESRGVELTIEDDGRVFPKSNSSQTIIDCLLKSATTNNVRILTKRNLVKITKIESKFTLEFSNGDEFTCDYLIFTTGSSRKGYDFIKLLGHKIVDPVPSLFTFTVKNKLLTSLAGLSIKNVEVCIKDTVIPIQNGPLLITHWGLSGPAIIKSSAWGAVELNKLGYKFKVSINLLPHHNHDNINKKLNNIIANNRNKKCISVTPFSELPLRFWGFICQQLNIENHMFKQLNSVQLKNIVRFLTDFSLEVTGKSNFKDEFVTAGGVDLKDVNLKTMESKLCDGVFFAGEVLNIDGVTGGFNFQNAWTTAKQIKIT